MSDPDRAASRSQTGRSPRFWGIFVPLCILSFVCALDVVIITTSLPTITEAIGGALDYVWIANSFVVASAVLQPLFGQLADVFGRQIPLVSSTALFLLGSGLSGGAQSPAMLMGGRTVQGLGAGGLYVLLDIVCCDLVPLRDRGKWVGLMNSFAGLAAALGPALGGVIAQSNWRWIFYLNLPICGVALLGVLLFMRMRVGPSSSEKTRLRSIDYIGSAIFTPSIIAILLGLIMGGVKYPWSSWRVILPLILGSLGWVSFHVQQAFASHPSVPARLFANRTSATAFLLTFLSSALVQSVSYFLPIYFQAVKATTVIKSGTYFLPYAIGTLFFAIVGGVLLSSLGKYKSLHLVSFALTSIGLGLLTLLDRGTPTAVWVIIQLIASAGLGLSVSTMLPAIMAALPESDVASSTAAYVFLKTFGYVWGVAIPSILFNAVFDSNLDRVSDPAVRDQLANGAAYAFASQVHRMYKTSDPSLWEDVSDVYADTLRTIWWVGLGTSIVGFIAVFMERSLELRTDLDTAYGLEDSPQPTEK
ncbi:MFS general substrate transporter [Xylariaceae sp. FL0016]|nr:MFS general substrate transporter [Xylariaceae sp. FL0016]